MMTARSRDAVGFGRLPFPDLFGMSSLIQIWLSKGLEK